MRANVKTVPTGAARPATAFVGGVTRRAVARTRLNYCSSFYAHRRRRIPRRSTVLLTESDGILQDFVPPTKGILFSPICALSTQLSSTPQLGAGFGEARFSLRKIVVGGRLVHLPQKHTQ